MPFIVGSILKYRISLIMGCGSKKTQYVVNKKFVKHLENTDFYELRVSISSDEYRTVLFAIDNYSFIQSKRVILLNSFVKKGTKQYKAEIKLAERLLKKYLEG